MSPPRSKPVQEERPIAELLSDVTSQLQQLVRKEMELARVETKEQFSRAGKGAAAFGAAGAVGFVALILLASAAAWGLAEVVPVGLAFLIVAVVLLAVAAGLFAQGKAKLARFKPVPEQTVQTIKQDVQTAKDSFQQGAQEPAHPNQSAYPNQPGSTGQPGQPDYTDAWRRY